MRQRVSPSPHGPGRCNTDAGPTQSGDTTCGPEQPFLVNGSSIATTYPDSAHNSEGACPTPLQNIVRLQATVSVGRVIP